MAEVDERGQPDPDDDDEQEAGESEVRDAAPAPAGLLAEHEEGRVDAQVRSVRP